MAISYKEASDKIAANIRAERARANLTQQQLADAVNVSVDTVGSWESGKSAPSLITAYDLSSALGCPIGSLVNI